MVLFTDGGSTKCDWVLLDGKGSLVLRTQTLGLNPTVISSEEIRQRIKANSELTTILESVEILDFYGAGCGTHTPRNKLKQELGNLFTNAKVNVQEDLAAAVYAVTTKPGIICILGTGSNSCYFDGENIHTPIPALGYSVMDEASGNYFGKELLRDYFYKRMPAHLIKEFETSYDLNPDEIKMNVYKGANPNAYLASFAQFIFSKEITEPYLLQLVEKGIRSFVACRVQTFSEASTVPIHFVGSIAHYSKAIIANVLNEHGLQLGKVIQRPMDGLMAYYQEKIKMG